MGQSNNINKINVGNNTYNNIVNANKNINKTSTKSFSAASESLDVDLNSKIKKNGNVSVEQINLNKLSGSKDDAKNSNYISKNNIFYEGYVKNKDNLKYQIQPDNKTVLISDKDGNPLWWTTVDAIKIFNNSNNGSNSSEKKSNNKITTTNNNSDKNMLKAEKIDFSKISSSRQDAKNRNFIPKQNVLFDYYIKNNIELKYEKMNDNTVLISDKDGNPLWWTTVDAIKNSVVTPQNNQSNANNTSNNQDSKKKSLEKKTTSNTNSNNKKREYGSFDGELKYYCQGSGDWGSFGGYGSIASLGCGPTSIATVISSLTGNRVTPDDVTSYMSQNGMCSSDGATWSDIEKIEKHFADMYSSDNKKFYTKSISDLSELKKVLASGNAMAVTLEETLHNGYGLHLSNGNTMGYDGHYIVLTGVKDNGSSDDYDVIIADPASESNNGASVSVHEVANGNANSSDAPSFWVVSSQPFE